MKCFPSLLMKPHNNCSHHQLSIFLISNCQYKMTNHIILEFSIGKLRLQVEISLRVILHQLMFNFYEKGCSF